MGVGSYIMKDFKIYAATFRRDNKKWRVDLEAFDGCKWTVIDI